MKRITFERALHSWPSWFYSIQRSRLLLGYDPTWSKDKCLEWIEDNVHPLKDQAESELKRLELPLSLQPYWIDCFTSNYYDKNGKPSLRKITSHLSNLKSEPQLPFDQSIVSYPGEDIDDPWIRVEIRIHERFVTEKILSDASRYAFRTVENEKFRRNVQDHPLTDLLQGGRPPIDEDRAIECARLADEEGLTEVEIGKRFGWKIQKNEFDVPIECRTARRYISLGRKLRKSQANN